MVTTNIIHISDAINSRLDPHQFNHEFTPQDSGVN